MKLASIFLAGLGTLAGAQKAFPVSQGPSEKELMPYSWDDVYDFMSTDFQDQFHIQYADGSIRGRRVDKYLPEDEIHLRKRLVSDEDSAWVMGGRLYLDLMMGWSKGYGVGGEDKRYQLSVNLWNNATILLDYEDIPSCPQQDRQQCDQVTDPQCAFAGPSKCDYKDNPYAYNTTNGTNVNEVLLRSDSGYNISLIHQSITGNLYTDWVEMGDPAYGAALPVDGFAFVAARRGTTQNAGIGFAPGHYLTGLMNTTNITTDFAAALLYSGYTESRSLALYLANGSTASPHMMFGGLDTSLAKDNFFVSYPLLTGNNFSYPTQYMVVLTGVSVTAEDGTSASLGELGGSCGDSKGDCVPVGFDTTTYMSYLPRNVVINLAIQLNAMYSSDLQLWIQSCAYRTIGGYLNIELTSNVFSVPISQMLMPMLDDQGNAMKFNGGEDACYLALRPSENNGYNSLGLGFMQNFYMVFDPDDNYVSLGTLKSQQELDTEVFKNRYPNPVKPLKPGRLSKIANVTTVSEQAQITFQYVPPQVLTEILTTTSDGVAIQQGPLGGAAPTSANSLLVLTYGSSVMSLQGIPIGTSVLESGTVSGNARIDPTGATTRSTTSTTKPPQIQILGTPVSGSLTIFKQGSPTEAPRMAKNAPLGNTDIGAPRSGAWALQGLGVTLGMGLVAASLFIIA
ncbi:Aspartic proteinase yapsin-7 [Yarrowia sp. C11]|nr:Aspartic proteinase yapsin-7 [Yarrowia sp. C11]KAG5370627.1 Aspartic proteinase yapsin-7 [Yarrowia sp. E02]